MSIGSEELVQIAICRRLDRALLDLGLNEVLPANWLSFKDDSCHFSPIAFKALTRLVAHLEDASQLEPSMLNAQSETFGPGIANSDSLKTLVEFHEYQSIPVGYHLPLVKVS